MLNANIPGQGRNAKTQFNNSGDDCAVGSNASAKREPLKITAIYFFAGSLWIFITDILEGIHFSADFQMIIISISKGMLYVLLSSLLIYSLTYPPIKKLLAVKDALKKSNDELEISNQSYKQLYNELDEKQALTKSLINSIPDLLFYKSTDYHYLGCNKAFEAFLGKPESEILGLTDFDLFDREIATLFRNMDIEMMKTNTPRRNDEIIPFPDARRVYFETNKSPYHDAAGNIIGIIGISRDISERKTREEKIQYLSYHDALTGVYNRAFFQESLNRLNTAENLPLSIIVGDVNGMKLFNDAFGHMEGDKVLIKIADILKQCCRQDDIVTRIGGDEFSILLPNTDSQAAKTSADKIRAACEKNNSIDSIICPDIALGFATKSNTHESFDEIIVLAEDIMYRRKLLESQSLRSSILASIKSTMFEKSNETKEHAERLATLSKKIGLAIGLSEDKIDELELAATLHDIGKISIDQNILTKEEKLSNDDWRKIKKHPEVGYRIASSCPELRHIADYILCHHERWDGLGYPQGLSGEDIPIISRIISIADAYDAITEDRSYRKSLSRENALKEIMCNAGTQFDPAIAKTFVDEVIGV